MHNPTRFALAALAVAGLVAAPAFADAPLAPMAPLSAQARKTKLALERAFAKAGQHPPKVHVPTKREVGIPAYPGSWIVQTSGGLHPGFKVVELVSPASTAKVIAFYGAKLRPRGFKKAKAMGHMTFFHKGKPEPGATLYADQPSVGIYASKCGAYFKGEFASKVCRAGYSRVVITYRSAKK